MKYLKNAGDVRSLHTKEEVREYLAFRKENDEWRMPYIDECSIVGIENLPLFNQNLKTQTFQVGETEVEGCESSEETMQECVADSGLFLVLPGESKMELYPTIYTAFDGICRRAGLFGTTITNSTETKGLRALPISEKAAWLSRGMSLHKNACQVLIRDEAAVAMLSSDYRIIPADEAVVALEKELALEHPDAAFSCGKVSHEYLVLDYNLNDPVMEESFRLLLESIGIQKEVVKAGVRFSTSDVGNARCMAVPYYCVNGIKMILGRGCGCRHDGRGSVKVFSEEIEKLGMLFKESEDRIEELGNIEIRYPAGCLQRIFFEEAKGLFSRMRKEATNIIEDAVVKYSGGKTCAAIDIFMLLQEMAGTKANLTPTQMIGLQEELQKLMYLDYGKCDVPYAAVD